MSTPKKSNRTAARIAAKQLALRDQMWPDLDPDRLWNRKMAAGFSSIPRTMPLILRVMDDLSVGKPVSRVYLDLWCRGFDECFVVVSNPQENAFYAGFTGQRAVATWRDRMGRLVNLGFIAAKAGVSGEYHYVLLWNPYLAVKALADRGVVHEATYNALCDRMQQIGAKDFSG